MWIKLLKIWNKPYQWFESFVKPGDDLGVRGLYRIFVFALVVVLSIFIIDIGLTAYTYKSEEPNHGIFGDFFGGIANPFLTFLTFMGLLLTIVVQKVELRDSREEMRRSADALSEQVDAFRKQSFEVTFLKMLEIHSTLTQSIDLVLVKANKTVTGSDCMERFHSRLKTKYRGRFRDGGKEFYITTLEGFDELKLMYADFWDPTRKNLHSWHESLSVILGYIQSESNSVEPYLSMVSAQLSEYEKILVFYHVALHGESRLRALVLELGFLRNLPADLLLHRSHMNLVPTVSFL
ncbi:hypothetical protein HDC30_000363 [Pseudomonas sp. JAI115]|uniref:putative phage abortive infection protein n=1 Tax=Pseudomonas sp. JAI115 TaxID=2723061 RepID=UPI00160DB48B|nr:putative phage abortive infection protein [Pseudomonas sp. JAI115]MBB6153169.1 hypothetical protein [Pseudomonas sp. JAI115]